MRAAVVYESLFGNTAAVAAAIAAGIRAADPAADVTCAPVTVHGPDVGMVDLLVAGGPTHFLGMTSRRSRQMARQYAGRAGRPSPGTAPPGTAARGTAAPGTAAPGTAAPGTAPPGTAAPGNAAPGNAAPGNAALGAARRGMREWLDQLPPAASAARAAAFDTRLNTLFPGSAARWIARRLRERGYQIAVMPEGFLVEAFQGPLSIGERDRAQAWGAFLAGTQQAQGHPATPGGPGPAPAPRTGTSPPIRPPAGSAYRRQPRGG